jgi:hypothetical protein
MNLSILAVTLLAPARTGGGGFHLSNATLAIIVIVVVLGGLAIIGWRSRDGATRDDEKAARERED